MTRCRRHPRTPAIGEPFPAEKNLAAQLRCPEEPVAVTRHGATVGYFIPTRAERGAERLRALREAGAAVDAMLARAGTKQADIESVVQEFAAARQAKAAAKQRPAPKRRG